jgi:hypothetical protein
MTADAQRPWDVGWLCQPTYGLLWRPSETQTCSNKSRLLSIYKPSFCRKLDGSSIKTYSQTAEEGSGNITIFTLATTMHETSVTYISSNNKFLSRHMAPATSYISHVNAYWCMSYGSNGSQNSRGRISIENSFEDVKTVIRRATHVFTKKKKKKTTITKTQNIKTSTLCFYWFHIQWLP